MNTPKTSTTSEWKLDAEQYRQSIEEAKELSYTDEEINRANAQMLEDNRLLGKQNPRYAGDIGWKERRRREQAARRAPRKTYTRNYKAMMDQLAAFYGVIDSRLDRWFEEREAALGVEPFATRVRKRKERERNMRALVCADLIRRGYLAPRSGKGVR